MLENEGPPSITLARHNTQMLEEWKVVVCTQIRKEPSFIRLVLCTIAIDTSLHFCHDEDLWVLFLSLLLNMFGSEVMPLNQVENSQI
jgi:hypothetical protein